MVVVTGAPDSGTSFLVNYIAALGFNLGDSNEIQGVTGMHPHGTGEHMGISHETWGALNGSGHVDYYPGSKLPWKPLSGVACRGAKERVGRIIEEQRIELAKDCSAPWTYRCYPWDTRFVVISRRWKNMTKGFLEYIGYKGIKPEDVQEGWIKWRHVCWQGIKAERDWYEVQYEHFYGRESRGVQLLKLCRFLGIEGVDDRVAEGMDALWHPRLVGRD